MHGASGKDQNAENTPIKRVPAENRPQDFGSPDVANDGVSSNSVANDVVAYVLGDASTDEARAMEHKLAADAKLAAEEARFRRKVKLIRSLPSPAPSPKAMQHVFDAARAHAESRRAPLARIRRIVFSRAAIAAALVAMIGLGMAWLGAFSDRGEAERIGFVAQLDSEGRRNIRPLAVGDAIMSHGGETVVASIGGEGFGGESLRIQLGPDSELRLLREKLANRLTLELASGEMLVESRGAKDATMAQVKEVAVKAGAKNAAVLELGHKPLLVAFEYAHPAKTAQFADGRLSIDYRRQPITAVLDLGASKFGLTFHMDPALKRALAASYVDFKGKDLDAASFVARLRSDALLDLAESESGIVVKQALGGDPALAAQRERFSVWLLDGAVRVHGPSLEGEKRLDVDAVAEARRFESSCESAGGSLIWGLREGTIAMRDAEDQLVGRYLGLGLSGEGRSEALIQRLSGRTPSREIAIVKFELRSEGVLLGRGTSTRFYRFGEQAEFDGVSGTLLSAVGHRLVLRDDSDRIVVVALDP